MLHEGILSKRGTKALMKRTNPRHVFVFSEAVLITKLTGNKFEVHSALPLSWITLMDTEHLDGALPHSFCIVAPERSFELKASCDPVPVSGASCRSSSQALERERVRSSAVPLCWPATFASRRQQRTPCAHAQPPPQYSALPRSRAPGALPRPHRWQLGTHNTPKH